MEFPDFSVHLAPTSVVFPFHMCAWWRMHIGSLGRRLHCYNGGPPCPPPTPSFPPHKCPTALEIANHVLRPHTFSFMKPMLQKCSHLSILIKPLRALGSKKCTHDDNATLNPQQGNEFAHSQPNLAFKKQRNGTKLPFGHHSICPHMNSPAGKGQRLYRKEERDISPNAFFFTLFAHSWLVGKQSCQAVTSSTVLTI